jgi:hypothetical protein
LLAQLGWVSEVAAGTPLGIAVASSATGHVRLLGVASVGQRRHDMVSPDRTGVMEGDHGSDEKAVL